MDTLLIVLASALGGVLVLGCFAMGVLAIRDALRRRDWMEFWADVAIFCVAVGILSAALWLKR